MAGSGDPFPEPAISAKILTSLRQAGIVSLRPITIWGPSVATNRSIVDVAAGLAFFLLIFLSFTPVAPVFAEEAPSVTDAGFDCDKASGVDEKIICSDPLLRQADADLASHYVALICATPDSARVAVLRSDEHGWIMLRNKECDVTKATKVTDATRAAYVDCFLDAYEERIGDLDRMKEDPSADPVTISTPIRKSLFSAIPDRAPPPAEALADTGLYAKSAEHPLLAWQPDGSLIVLGRGADTAGGALYLWRAGKPSVLLVPQIKKPERIEKICARGGEIYLASHNGVTRIAVADGSVQDVPAASLPSEVKISCGLDPELRVVGDAAGKTSLVVGGGDQRLVQWRDGAMMKAVAPPIRIDRRYGLAALYEPFAQDYVVGAQQWPAEMRQSVERRWAKTNCLPYWRVSAKNGEANRACIPYGDYIGPAPQPLPTGSAVFFAIHGAGLFKVIEGGAQRILPGQADGAVVAPDGCRIAFAGALKDGHPAIWVLDSCKLLN